MFRDLCRLRFASLSPPPQVCLVRSTFNPLATEPPPGGSKPPSGGATLPLWGRGPPSTPDPAWAQRALSSSAYGRARSSGTSCACKVLSGRRLPGLSYLEAPGLVKHKSFRRLVKIQVLYNKHTTINQERSCPGSEISRVEHMDFKVACGLGCRSLRGSSLVA